MNDAAHPWADAAGSLTCPWCGERGSLVRPTAGGLHGWGDVRECGRCRRLSFLTLDAAGERVARRFEAPGAPGEVLAR